MGVQLIELRRDARDGNALREGHLRLVRLLVIVGAEQLRRQKRKRLHRDVSVERRGEGVQVRIQGGHPRQKVARGRRAQRKRAAYRRAPEAQELSSSPRCKRLQGQADLSADRRMAFDAALSSQCRERSRASRSVQAPTRRGREPSGADPRACSRSACRRRSDRGRYPAPRPRCGAAPRRRASPSPCCDNRRLKAPLRRRSNSTQRRTGGLDVARRPFDDAGRLPTASADTPVDRYRIPIPSRRAAAACSPESHRCAA